MNEIQVYPLNVVSLYLEYLYNSPRGKIVHLVVSVNKYALSSRSTNDHKQRITEKISEIENISKNNIIFSDRPITILQDKDDPSIVNHPFENKMISLKKLHEMTEDVHVQRGGDSE